MSISRKKGVFAVFFIDEHRSVNVAAMSIALVSIVPSGGRIIDDTLV